MEVMPDHVHLLVECDPQFGIAKLIKYIKGRSSRILRAEYPWLRNRLPTLWTNSYFVSTLGRMHQVAYHSSNVKLTVNGLRFSLGMKVKKWFGIDSFYIPMPAEIDHKKIKEFGIVPRNGCFYLSLSYEIEPIPADVKPDSALMIDHGVDNWLTCVDIVGNNFIVDGKHVKSKNQWYNKSVAYYKTGKSKNYWTNELARLTEKHNRFMRDAVHKAARQVIKHCVSNPYRHSSFWLE